MSGMLTAPQLNILGSLVTEALADSDVASLTSGRVRGAQPRPVSDTYAGDARGPGEYVAFVILSTLDDHPHPQLPITFAEYAVNAYGVTPQNAAAVWHALVKAFHKVRTRTKSNGLGIYQSLVLTGGEQDRDPDTQQPVVRGTLRVIATALAVEAAGS